MKKIEYRVSPVIRWNLTRYQFEELPDGMCEGDCESLGEFDNERKASRVMDAMYEADKSELNDVKKTVITEVNR